MPTKDLQVTVSPRKVACVLDPELLVMHACGPQLALRLSRVFEVWLTRSFWRVIDAGELWLAQQRAGADRVGRSDRRQRPDVRAIERWIDMRDQTDAGSWVMCWIDDHLPASHMGDRSDKDIMERYEMAALGLSHRVVLQRAPQDAMVPWCDGLDAVAASLDTLALMSVVDSAIALCAVQDDALPAPVRTLQRAGMDACALDPLEPDSLFFAERRWIREAFVEAGLPMLLWGGPKLAVVRLATNGGNADPWSDMAAGWYRV